MRVGVLALQGDFAEHEAVLEHLQVESCRVKNPQDLGRCDGLILPGGESTVLGMLLESVGLIVPIQDRAKEGMPIFGTCAGMILLSREITDGRPDQLALGLIDIAVRRNGFGRQIKSFEADVTIPQVDLHPVTAVFIRAPVIDKVGDEVEVLGSVTYRFEAGIERSVPVVCQQDGILATSFHPELTSDHRLHEYFVNMIASR